MNDDSRLDLSDYPQEAKDPQEETKPDYEDLKVRINTFLWENLPGHVTLKEMEREACVIWDRVTRIWDRSGVSGEG